MPLAKKRERWEICQSVVFHKEQLDPHGVRQFTSGSYNVDSQQYKESEEELSVSESSASARLEMVHIRLCKF